LVTLIAYNTAHLSTNRCTLLTYLLTINQIFWSLL